MNDLGSGIVIEFFGAPGVGKSYLAKGLSAYFKTSCINISDQSLSVGQMSRFHRLVYKSRIIIPMLMSKPSMLLMLLDFTFNAGVRAPVAFMRVLINWLYIIALVKRESKLNGVVILDQGFIQALWSTVFRGMDVGLSKTSEFITFLLRASFVKQLVVVHLSVDHKKHRMRLDSRLHGCSPLDGGDSEKFQRGLRIADLVGDVVGRLEHDATNQMINNVYFKNDDNADISNLYEKLLERTIVGCA